MVILHNNNVSLPGLPEGKSHEGAFNHHQTTIKPQGFWRKVLFSRKRGLQLAATQHRNGMKWQKEPFYIFLHWLQQIQFQRVCYVLFIFKGMDARRKLVIIEWRCFKMKRRVPAVMFTYNLRCMLLQIKSDKTGHLLIHSSVHPTIRCLRLAATTKARMAPCRCQSWMTIASLMVGLLWAYSLVECLHIFWDFYRYMIYVYFYYNIWWFPHASSDFPLGLGRSNKSSTVVGPAGERHWTAWWTMLMTELHHLGSRCGWGAATDGNCRLKFKCLTILDDLDALWLKGRIVERMILDYARRESGTT